MTSKTVDITYRNLAERVYVALWEHGEAEVGHVSADKVDALRDAIKRECREEHFQVRTKAAVLKDGTQVLFVYDPRWPDDPKDTVKQTGTMRLIAYRLGVTMPSLLSTYPALWSWPAERYAAGDPTLFSIEGDR
jgi:hypothetical protein